MTRAGCLPFPACHGVNELSLHLRERGLSAVETILIFTLIMTVAALVVPKATRTIEDVTQPRAFEGCSAISTALLQYRADTSREPIGYDGKPTYRWLRGIGAAPEFNFAPPGQAGSVEWFLNGNVMGGGSAWAGPYLSNLGADPWGRRYVVYVEAWWPKDEEQEADGDELPPRAWVLSSGPDGLIETRPFDVVPVGDDIGILIE